MESWQVPSLGFDPRLKSQLSMLHPGWTQASKPPVQLFRRTLIWKIHLTSIEAWNIKRFFVTVSTQGMVTNVTSGSVRWFYLLRICCNLVWKELDHIGPQLGKTSSLHIMSPDVYKSLFWIITAKRHSHHSPVSFQTPQCKRRIQYVISLSSLMVLPTLNALATRPKIL